MPVNEPEPDAQKSGAPPTRRRRRIVTRRNAIIVGILVVVGAIALVLIALLSYRLGYVDAYIAGQVKDTLGKYGIRAEIREFHTAITPQTVEMLGVELYDAQTGEKLGKIDRLLATVRVEDLYAVNLQRNINLKDLQVEGLELWVNFDAQGRSNFRNVHIPPPEPNQRILFAYSTAHIDLKNALIHYGDALHRLSGEARNVQATIQPDDPNAPSSSWMNTVSLSATNSTFAYDNRPINNINIEARGRVNQIRAEIQELKLRSPVAEATLSGVMGDWRKLQYNFNVTSTVDLTQLSDVLASGTALRGVGNFSGTITGEGEKYQVTGGVKSDALAAAGVRLQGLNVTAKGTGQGASYDFNGRAVVELLNAGDFQLNAVQVTGGVMGTGSDFRWVGELRAAAEKSYGTTITGLLLRDAVAEYKDGVLTASAPQLTGNALTTAAARVAGGIQANEIRVRSADGVTTATIASAKAGKIQAAKATIDGVTAKNIEANSRGGVTNVTVKELQVGAANFSGAQTGSINIAGVRLAIRNGRVEGTTSDINAGTVKLENGQVENVKLAKPAFTLEPSGRYRASADLSLGGGVLGEMKLGPAHAAVVASSDQIQLTNFVAEALNGRATGNATIALTKSGTSKVSSDFNNFDLGSMIALISGRAIPVASRATGRADLTLTDTDISTATGSVNAQLQGAPTTNDLAPLSGDVAVTANHGLFQIQRASLQTAATTLKAAGQFSIDEPVSNLRVDVASTDASEIQRLLITSGALPEVEEQFHTYGIDLGGKLNFNGTLAGALKDPLVSGHAELGSLIMNGRDLGSLSANVTSTATETRVDNGRLSQPNGGGAQFALLIPRTGESNTSIEATLDRMDAANLIAALPMTRETRAQIGDTEAEASGSVKITGIPNNMSGVADLRFGKGRLAGEPLQSLTAHATFVGSSVNVETLDANFDAGHIAGNGKFDTKTKAFDVKFNGDRVQLERLAAFSSRPGLPQLGGTASLTASASGNFDDVTSWQINFNGESNDVTIDGRAAGALKLVGVTENKQLNVTFTTTGLLGANPQTITARVDLSNEKLPAVVESTITAADLTQVLKILLPETNVAVSGRATGTLKLSGNLMTENDQGEEVFSWRGLTGSATFNELTINVADVQLAPIGPLVIDFAPNELNFHETRFTGPGTNVTLAGTVATGPGGRENLDVNGDVNLRIFSGISPDVFSSGVAKLFLRVTGTYDDPRMLGTAEVSGASVSVFSGDQTITVSNLTGLIRFNSNQAQIERLEGMLGGGKVTASGGALLTGSARGRFAISVRGNNVTLNYPKDFRSTVTADLSVSGDLQNQFITGYVNVKRTEYTKDVELADLINQRPETTIEEGGQFSFAETAVLDKVRVEGRNALVMRNNLGDVVASVNLQLDGPIGDPIIQGRVTATRGTLNFRNSPYEITRGLVDFPGRLSADPILNIEGQTVIRGYRVTAGITGPLSHPQTIVGSEPALPQADVVSLILTGSLSTTDQSTSVLAQSGLGTAASLLTDALINAPVSRASNKLFGLSRLEISPVIAGNGSTPTARLTVARRISKDVTVTYSTNLASDPNQILAVEYRVSNRLSFVAQYEQGSLRNLSTHSNNYSFEIRFRKRF
ncbi:MAG TPA: translocation/assembly module TamB domain-containing protein [Pyrinomonadaceae bacterium]|jgi:translocation and assembly module TamB|nr:translocation/assembly module TamB domain-containing protein [Pyrinomonadaceae bacterium]